MRCDASESLSCINNYYQRIHNKHGWPFGLCHRLQKMCRRHYTLNMNEQMIVCFERTTLNRAKIDLTMRAFLLDRVPHVDKIIISAMTAIAKSLCWWGPLPAFSVRSPFLQVCKNGSACMDALCTEVKESILSDAERIVAYIRLSNKAIDDSLTMSESWTVLHLISSVALVRAASLFFRVMPLQCRNGHLFVRSGVSFRLILTIVTLYLQV